MSDASREPKETVEAALRGPRRPVARYRPAVIAAGLGVILLLVGVGFLIAFGGGHRPSIEPSSPPPEAEAAVTPPDLDRRLPKSYDDPLAQRTTDVPMAGGADAPTSAAPAPTPDPPSPEIQHRRDEQRAARASSPLFAAGGGASAPVAPNLEIAAPPAATPPAELSAKERFVAAASGGPAYMAAGLRPGLSDHEIKAGTVIPAALVTGLNSDLPGPVIAQVTEPVFDSATGRIRLIPQGARLIGKYDSQVSYGQDRALVVWTRLIYPDGRSIDLGTMIGADLTGAGGLADRVDTHLPKLARAVGLSSLISMGAAAAQNSLSRSSGGVVLQDGAAGLSAAASQAGQRIVDRDLQRAPTLRVRPGWPLRVLVDKDLILD